MAQPTITILNGRRIALGVAGSIAVYKVVDLASKLTQAGASVDVIMTEAAQRFVTPLTFQSVTGRAVYTSLWESGASGGLPTHIAHVGLGESADLLVIAPATANTLAKIAHGGADDLLSVTALTSKCPVLVAPAMDGIMYQHPATVENVKILEDRGVTIIEPEIGRFASGLTGKGRLPETPTLIGHIRLLLARNGPLGGRKIVVSAGGTREPLDPVRYITNHSSGKQGYALAQAALDAGADVTLINAARDLVPPIGVKPVQTGSAEAMCEAVLAEARTADALLMAAAVADYRPATVAQRKIKKQAEDPNAGMTLDLARTRDILVAVHDQREQTGKPLISVGFAAESEDLLANARSKLERKGLDLIVVNDISASDAGFRADTNRVTILDRDGGQEHLPLMAKVAVAEEVIRHVVKLLPERVLCEQADTCEL